MAADDSDISDIQKQELEDSTSCCICTDIYKCPKLLPCGHTFCLNCIEETGINTNKRPEDEMPCPMCRREFKIPSDGFTVLQNNYYVEGLIRVAQILGQSSSCDACLEENQEEAGKEVQRAEMYCCDCKQKLCEDCCKHHRKLKLTKNHELLSISGQLPADKDLMPSLIPIICELHKQEDLKIYCNACKTVVCSICFIENHEGHKGIHVTKAGDDFRKEIANNVEKVETCMSQAEIKKLQITKSKQDVHEKLVSLEYDIIRKRDRLRQVVDKQANELLEELSSTRQSKMKEVQIETDNIDALLAILESYNSYCRKIMTKGSACDICRSVGDISVRGSELQEEIQSLTERQLTPLSLCFIETEFEEGEERNFIGQLTGCLKNEENGHRNLIKQSLEVKADHKRGTNSGQSKDRSELETEGESKDDSQKSSENLKQQAKYTDLCPLRSDKYSVMRQRNLVGKRQEKLITAKNKGVMRSSTRLDKRYHFKKEVTSKDVKRSENPKQEDRYQKLSTLSDYDYEVNTRHEAKYRDSTNSQGLQENEVNDLELNRVCALMTLPNVDIDEDIFYYLFRCRNHELSRISDKCNLFEPYKVEQGHKLAVDVKPQYHLESVIAEFEELYRQATTDHVKIPEGVDLETLKSLVETIAEFKDVELRFMSKERVCNIAGCYRETSRAKDHLLHVIKSNLPTSHKYDTSQNKTARLTIQIRPTNAPMHKEPTKSVLLDPTTAAISQAGMSVYTVLNQSHDSLLLSVSNTLTVELKCGDLTNTINADVVVSYINKQLDMDGSLSYQIMKVAGSGAQTELLSHKNRLSSLPVGCLVHTSAGNLRGVKAIIHVVRPQANEFPHNDQNLMNALRTVFANCLNYTNDVLKLKSICLPPVGFGFYGAQLVVDSFLGAVETFASAVNNGKPSAAAQHRPHHLNYIQLVSNERYCIGQLMQCIKRRLGAH